MASTPTCWRCGSQRVRVRFLGKQPTFHAAKECDCPHKVTKENPCGWASQGELTCDGCGNVWIDGDISEYGLAH